jgi:hypothetical protein
MFILYNYFLYKLILSFKLFFYFSFYKLKLKLNKTLYKSYISLIAL